MRTQLAGWWLILLWGLLAGLPAWAGPATAADACAPRILATSAAREDPSSRGAPTKDWVSVTLPDLWARRWPGHDGAVWYRIDWTRDCDSTSGVAQKAGLGIDGISMAGEVYINDEHLWSDMSLVEPLSMSWNMPRWWILPESALRTGVNTIWIRTVGRPDLSPGLGRLRLGPAAQVQDAHAHSFWRQRTVHYITLGLSSALGGVFLVVWCMRRRERAFGWYAAMSLCWVLYLSTMLAVTPWPLSDTLSYSRLNNMAFLLYVLCFCLFTWRFSGQHLPRLERSLWMATMVGLLVSLLAPRPIIELSWGAFVLIFLANCAQFPFHAWRTRDPQHVLLALCWLVFLVVGVHDLAVLLSGWRAHDMWGAVTSLVTAIFMALLLGGRLVAGMQRIESFNHELEAHVAVARAELADVLQREHKQALTHAMLQERMHIVHDLHDGLGGSLVRSMALVEQAPQPLSNERMLSLLKLLRDDLRQVIDHGSSAGATVPATPVQWAAPLRHRFTRLFDEMEVRSSWAVDERWRHPPNALLCLGLTRLVEEALSNVIKHSRANHVSVTCAQPEAGRLHLVIADDGVGFDVAAVRSAGLSVGMRSMAARMERLGGTFEVESGAEGTVVSVTVAFDA